MRTQHRYMKRLIPVGKKIIDSIYFHKDYTDSMGDYITKATFDMVSGIVKIQDCSYEIVKWSKKANTVSFISSPDFDSVNEPAVQSAVIVNLTKSTVVFRKYDPLKGPIYHHKWLMVGDDYKGFDVSEAKERSRFIVEKMAENPSIEKCKIGFKKYWDEVAIPLISICRE
jgi:hypothetical protein